MALDPFKFGSGNAYEQRGTIHALKPKYTNMLPKIGKYAVKYGVVFSVFDLKILYLTHLNSAFHTYTRFRI